MNTKNIIICRCEDVSLHDIHTLLHQGYTRFEDLKRLLRVGMGPCQGNTCMLLIKREIANFLHQDISEVKGHVVRPLTLGVPLHAIVKGESDQ